MLNKFNFKPFWPTGTGIARGFLSALDTAWMLRGYGLNRNSAELYNEREHIYQYLSQTTIENLCKNHQDYSLDPATRYTNINRLPLSSIENIIPQPTTDRLTKLIKDYCPWKTLVTWSQLVVQPYNLKIENFTTSWQSGLAFCAIIHRFRTDLMYKIHVKLI
jgi:hypothetical protein